MHRHAHDSADLDDRVRATWPGRWLLVALLLPVLAMTLVGAVQLWPTHAVHGDNANLKQLRPSSFTDATVVAARAAACGTGLDGSSCIDVDLRLPDHSTTTLNVNPGAGQPRLAVGDGVRLAVYRDSTGQPTYVFDDYQRHHALGWLALLSALGIVAVARLRGLAALAGVAVTGVGITTFVVPAVLNGHDPVAVALVACSALLFITLYLAHGLSARTSTALVGTLVGLGLCVALAAFATRATRITGLSNDGTLALQGFPVRLDLHALLVCGFVIGALGALNDVTITQASAVWELQGSDPAASARQLYRRAMRIGRDHVASSVYTLLFAYAGAALPALLVIALLNRPALEVINGDWAAVEIVRASVGVVGLAAAVPVTTALAVAVVRLGDRRRAGAPPPFPRQSLPELARSSAV
jgi:uncharacterized membrane protein